MAVKVLVVDDEEDLQALIIQRFRKQIRENQLEFIFAGNGVEALEKLKACEDIHIVLTDINMPEMDGLTLLSHLADINRLYKAVVVSAYGDMSNIRKAMNRGAADFVTKPIDFRDFEDTLLKTIDQYQLLVETAKVKEQLHRFENELTVASDIQKSFMPSKFALGFSNVEIFGKMIPAKVVGGDYFDFFQLSPTKLGFLIADVSGKGIPAALYMCMSKTLVHYIALKSESPVETLKEANKYLSVNNEACMFTTIFYGILDVKTGVLQYCNAGHEAPYIVSLDGTFTNIGIIPSIGLGVSDWQILGEDKDLLKEERVTLKENECLLLYTDGITESMNPAEEFYGKTKLEESLKNYSGNTLDEFTEALFSDVKKFAFFADQSDDMTTICVRWKPPQG